MSTVIEIDPQTGNVLGVQEYAPGDESIGSDGGYGFGYDNTGAWRLGCAPIFNADQFGVVGLLTLASLAKRFGPVVARRIAARRAQQQQQPQAPQQPAYSPYPPPGVAAPQPQPQIADPAHQQRPGLFTRFRSRFGAAEDGDTMPLPGPRPRCRIVRRGGKKFAQDEFGNEVEVMDDGYPEQDFSGDHDDDDDDYLGGEDGDDDEYEETNEAADELLGAAYDDDDDEFGGKEERLDKKISRLQDRLEKIKDKSDDMRGPFKKARRKKLAKRARKLRTRISKLSRKMNKARSERVKVKQAIAAAVVGGAVAGVVSRSSVNAPSALASSPKIQDAVRRAQVAAGMSFQVSQTPAGSGRLNRIQMYADRDASPLLARNALTVPAALVTAETLLTTESVPYLKSTIVGFTATTFGTAIGNGAIGRVRDFKIKGGATLFAGEGPANAEDFNTDLDHLIGLRAYPPLEDPNFATVQVSAEGDLDDVVIISCQAVVDIRYDDVHGPGVVGPYAG